MDRKAFDDLKTGKNSYGAANLGKSRAPAASSALMAPKGSTSRSGSLGDIFKTSDAFKKSQEAKYGKAKGGKLKKEKTMKYAKGGKMAPKFGAAMKKKSADTKGRAMVKKAGGGKCYASGGLIAGHKSADGIAKKGKTKGKMPTMKKGGYC
jgi:hypothetical protein